MDNQLPNSPSASISIVCEQSIIPNVNLVHPAFPKMYKKAVTASRDNSPTVELYSPTANPPSSESIVPTKKRRSKDELWCNYFNRLQSYCDFSNTPYLSVSFLENPFLFFYLKNSKVNFIFPIQSFNQKDSFRFEKKLTPTTWPLFFSAIGVPFISGTEEESLYNALYTLLINYKPNDATARLYQIYVRFPNLANALNRAAYHTFTTPDGLLLLKTPNSSKYNFRVWSSTLLLELFLKEDAYWKAMQRHQDHIPCQSILRPFFQELRAQKRGKRSNTPKNKTNQLPYLTYSFKNGQFQQYFYQKSEDTNQDLGNYKYSLMRKQGLSVQHSEKYFSIHHHSNESYDNSLLSILPFLMTLTGGSVESLQALSKLFYRIMVNSPGKSCATIVHSSLNAHTLHSVLSLLFECDTPSFPYPHGKTSIRLNTLTQKKYLMSLAEQNIYGRPLLFIDSSPPSPASFEYSHKLSQGKCVPLSDECIVGQQFKNKVHLLCITSNMPRAEALSHKLDSPLVNFSAYEQPLPENISFTEDEKHWLLSALPLRGMLLESFIKLPKSAKPQKRVSIDDGLDSFLMYCCCAGDGILTSDLYDAYCEYYSSLHGCACPYSQIKFTRRVKSSCGHSLKLEYKKVWINSSSQRWQFAGICLRKDWRNLIPHPLTSRLTDEFENELWGIHDIARSLVVSASNLPNTLSGAE